MEDQTTEPEIAGAVQQVANRYGIEGLESMIVLARAELDEARRAYAELSADEGPADGPAGTPVRRTVDDEFAAPTPFEQLLREAGGDSVR